MKRILLSLLAAIICSVICTIGRYNLVPNISMSDLIISAVANRMLIGFMIGVSRLRINYIAHGAFIGFIVTFSYSVGMLISQNIIGFAIYSSMGIIFGIFIEVFVTKIFKQSITNS